MSARSKTCHCFNWRQWSCKPLMSVLPCLVAITLTLVHVASLQADDGLNRTHQLSSNGTNDLLLLDLHIGANISKKFIDSKQFVHSSIRLPDSSNLSTQSVAAHDGDRCSSEKPLQLQLAIYKTIRTKRNSVNDIDSDEGDDEDYDDNDEDEDLDEDEKDDEEGSGHLNDLNSTLTNKIIPESSSRGSVDSSTSSLSLPSTSLSSSLVTLRPTAQEEITFTNTNVPCVNPYECNSSQCSSSEFRCISNGQCLSLPLKCDGRKDCEDNSDEQNCFITSTEENRECDTHGEFQCQDNTCINFKQRCDGELNCLDGSDEIDCSCLINQFRCKSMFECIDNKFRCDRKYDCRDGSDEFRCDENTCPIGLFRCKTGQCIAERNKCNGIKECVDGSDELDCPKQCQEGQFKCLDGLQCISRDLVCNQQYDCLDGSDELKCIENYCQDNMFRCRDGQCVSKHARCDFNKDCFDGSDEFDCQIICGVHEFECHVDGRCIHESLRCDGFYDCFDFSDEQNCENRTCRLSQFRCGTGLCIDRALLCNGEADCPDRADEMECWICRFGQFTCANGQCIEMSQRCDGRQDCNDNSDESDCQRTEITLQVYPERQTVRQGQEAVFRCRDEGDLRLPVRWTREEKHTMPPGAIDSRGRLSLINVQTNYSGVYVCSISDENKDTFRAQKAAYLTVQPNQVPASATPVKQCIRNEVSCANGECIEKDYVCDGEIDCSDQSDEQNCLRNCKPEYFQCDNGNCIQKIYRCDSENDCGDNSDEKFCEHESSLNSTCKVDEYQCESGNQCIPKNFHCDGRFDCQDKSDEIGCTSPTIVESPNEIIVVTEGETVTIKCRSIGIPMPFINWLKNSKHIPPPPRVTTNSVDGLGTLLIRDATLSDQGTYSCEAINSRDTVLAQHDTFLVVKAHKFLCQSPVFNDLANDISECLRCFCFGVSDVCHSSSVETRLITVSLRELTIVPLEAQANGTYLDVSNFYPPNQAAIRFDDIYKVHSVNSEVASLKTPDDVYFYWRLPDSFIGNQLMSYGGHLKYSIRYQKPFSPSPLVIPDVIMRGNGITLYHYEKDFVDSPAEGAYTINVRFWVGEWHRDDRNANSDIPPLFEDTTREDIMIVLQNVNEILIKASYDANLLESSIMNVELESAQISNNSDLTRSSYIEHCTCPEGYSGPSCERCAPRYIRQPAGRYLGRCNRVPATCQCNNHSDECDQFSGQCLNCRDHTEGFNCERCQRGFYNNPELNTNGQSQCSQCPCGQNLAEHLRNIEEQWDDFPEKWLFIPCRYDTLNRDVVCETCPIGYEGRLCEECARGYTRKMTESGALICELKEKCLQDEFRCGNGTCLSKSVRCNHVLDCLPEGNDEFGCACANDRFKCSDGNCIDIALQCDGVSNCIDNSDEVRCHDKSRCNLIGTMDTHSSDSSHCQCKSQVTGVQCDQCKPGSFFMNDFTPDGCIECYCFGLTRSCTSTFNLYRDYVELKMDQYMHGIVLRDLSNKTSIDQLSFDHINRELIFRDFTFQDDLYWQLPYQFVGNKVTSYGGYLNYTFRFEGNHFPRSDQTPTAILVGKNISLAFHYKASLSPFVSNVISIPLIENFWAFTNGQPARRKDLIIILSHLQTILLRATLSSDVNLIGLMSVTLDTTVERSGYSANEYSRVQTVEECHCPPGYMGTSCEKCAPGYKVYRRDDGNSLYQYDDVEDGLRCEPCFCNGHSNDCDPETGICINCQHYTTGHQCEKCIVGFDGNAIRGTPYDCIQSKNTNILVTEYTPPEITDEHDCNLNVRGERCDQCKEGFFNFNTDNPRGCLECFCSGATIHCSSSLYYKKPIHFNLTAIYPPQDHKFELTNRFRTNYYSDKIRLNIYHNELYFYSGFWLQDFHNLETKEHKPETLYWSLPSQFLGNRLTSYGGQLRYKQRYAIQTIGEFISDVDVFMLGNGILLQYINSEPFKENEERFFVVHINAEEGSWQKIDHLTHSSGLATRSDLMRALSNLEMIAIRATLHTQMKESILKDVSLDEAIPADFGDERALSVEQCHCPLGFIGLSCEQCAHGYISQTSQNGSLKCVQCHCNSHSTECDNTGKCVHCQDNTTGDHCERCLPAFYGDSTHGTHDDCKPCPCPSTNLSNNFSPTCVLDSDNKPTCTNCQVNYTGRNCEKCSPGYRGNPSVLGGRCQAFNSSQGIKVHIEGPRIRHIPAGVTINLKCTGVSQVSQFAFNLDWIKLEGQLPLGANEASGVLTLPNIQAEHSGTYICTGSDLESVAQAQTTILVESTIQPSVPKVRIEPRFQEVYLGEPVTFKCIADGFPHPQLHWSIGQNQILNPLASFTTETGVFFIPAAQKTDEAEYYCQATNSAGSDSVRTVLFVRPSDYHTLEYVHVDGVIPTARVSPSNYASVRGENVRLECNVTGLPVPSVRWTFTGGGPDGQLPLNSRELGGVLLISNVDTANGGVYTCIASNSFGTAEAQVRLKVVLNQSVPPTVNVEPIKQTIVQGQTGELRCVTTGSPKPIISWQKIGDQLDQMRHKTMDDKLIIERMEVNDRGLYVCRAENSEGISQGSAVVEIELREIPSIEIFRDSSQIVPRGSSTYFQCRITGGIPEPNVEWRRADGSPFTSNVEIAEGLLQFKEVSAQDEGIYTCIAENLAGRVTAQATLRIAGAPRIKILQNTPYRVRPNEHVRLECNLMTFDSSSEKRITLNWHRLKTTQADNHTLYALPMHPVNIYQDRAILEFRSIKATDNGIYVCTASSPTGNSEERIQVIVEEQSAHIVPDVYIEDKVVTVAAGSRAELRCFVRGTNRNVAIKWVRAENKSMPDMSRVENGTLTIDQVKPEDSGDYHCLGYVDSTGGQSPPRLLFRDRARLAVVAPPKIQIYPPLQTVRPGDTVYIDCVAYDSSHSVTVDWSRIGSELPTGVSNEVAGGKLVIRGVQETDAGRYLCTAVNAAGKSEAISEIIVDRRSEPIDTIKEEVAIVGSNLDLKCPSRITERNSDLLVVWKFENNDILPANSQLVDNELRIQNVNLDNSGRYICTASEAGSIVEQSSIVVKVKAIATLYIKLIPNRENLYLGDNLALNCSVQGDPMAQISWSLPYQNGPWLDNVYIKDNVLNVSQVGHANGGVYRCTVQTYAGVFNADYVLVIQEKPTTSIPDLVETRVVPYGSSLSLSCHTTLTHPLKHYWKKSLSTNLDESANFDEVLPEHSVIFANGTLHIPNTRASDAGTYICSATNMDSTVDISTIVIVEGVISRFLQKPLSYMSLPTLPNAYLTFEITISVKPENPDGLILFNGQGRNLEKNQGGDFISLGLNNGFVEFRFELGGGVTTIRSQKEVTINEWHLIRITRNRHIGKLKVNNQDIVTSSASEKYVGLDLQQPLYIGGVPNFSDISSSNGFTHGFVGCISLFKIGPKLYELIKDSITKHDVGRCDTCSRNPCLNSGTCRENVFRHLGFECVCPMGFNGVNCELTGSTCYPSACNHGFCVEKKSTKTFDCFCPFSQSGVRCERNISISEPFLTNGAYLAYRPPLHSLNKLNIKIKIKPKFDSSFLAHLLLYSAERTNGSGDYVALTLVNRSVEFRFDTGSGSTVIQNPIELEDDQWVDIEVKRIGREAYLTVAGSEPVYGQSPGRTHGLTLLTPLYLGGYNRSRLITAPVLDSFIHFEGCVGQLEINGKEVSLTRSHIESINVKDCGSDSLCQRSPCLNGGSCVDGNQTNYRCICGDDFIGENCERVKGPCDKSNSCANNGECENDGSNFVCHCSIGHSGKLCTDKVQLLNPQAAHMNGLSFLSFDNSYLTQANLGFELIKLKVMTSQSDGLLFFYGQSSETGGNGKDFVAVSLKSSKLEMTFELGSGLGQVQSDVVLSDDRVHDVLIKLVGQEGTIAVDGLSSSGRSAGRLRELNANGDIYFGGVPNFALMTAGRYSNGYSGCIWDIEIGISGALDLITSSKRSRNITPCEDEPDEGSAVQAEQ